MAQTFGREDDGHILDTGWSSPP